MAEASPSRKSLEVSVHVEYLKDEVKQIFDFGDLAFVVTSQTVFKVHAISQSRVEVSDMFRQFSIRKKGMRVQDVKFLGGSSLMYCLLCETKDVLVQVDFRSEQCKLVTQEVLGSHYESIEVSPLFPERVFLVGANEVDLIELKKQSSPKLVSKMARQTSIEYSVDGQWPPSTPTATCEAEGFYQIRRHNISLFKIGPQGKFFFVSEDAVIKKRSVGTKSVVASFEGHLKNVKELCFSKDKQTMIRYFSGN